MLIYLFEFFEIIKSQIWPITWLCCDILVYGIIRVLRIVITPSSAIECYIKYDVTSSANEGKSGVTKAEIQYMNTQELLLV